MAVTVQFVGKVSRINKSEQYDVVNFKVGAQMGRKGSDGKFKYLNADCAAWGALGTKLFLPYVKENDMVAIAGELEDLDSWTSGDKTGVNVKVKVLSLTLLPNSGSPASPDSNSDLNDLVAATSPVVSNAAKEDIPF